MRRIVRITSGGTLLLAGTIMLVTPGPGLLTIAAGLHVLSKDMPVAARLEESMVARVRRANPTDPDSTP